MRQAELSDQELGDQELGCEHTALTYGVRLAGGNQAIIHGRLSKGGQRETFKFYETDDLIDNERLDSV